MANDKKQLEVLLKKINAEIQEQSISSEDHIVQLFRVRDQGQMAMFKILGAGEAPGNATILEMIGYNAAMVEDHPVKKTVVGQINFAPDYILKSEQKLLAIVDLKGPDVNLDRWLGQISSYCQHLNVPLGLLFNGRELRVFVNTQIKSLKKHEESFDKERSDDDRMRNRFANQFVASAEIRDLKQMVNLLWRFSAPSLKSNPLNVAKKLITEAIAREEDEKRKSNIKKKVQELLASPSDELLSSLSAFDVWQNVKPVPTGAEIIESWKPNVSDVRHVTQPAISSVRKIANKTPVNTVVKQKIAEVCNKKGFEVLENAAIKGLKMRYVGDNGYHLVPQMPGVPAQLHVQGMKSVDAVRVIQHLDELLKS